MPIESKKMKTKHPERDRETARQQSDSEREVHRQQRDRQGSRGGQSLGPSATE